MVGSGWFILMVIGDQLMIEEVDPDLSFIGRTGFPCGHEVYEAVDQHGNKVRYDINGKNTDYYCANTYWTRSDGIRFFNEMHALQPGNYTLSCTNAKGETTILRNEESSTDSGERFKTRLNGALPDRWAQPLSVVTELSDIADYPKCSIEDSTEFLFRQEVQEAFPFVIIALGIIAVAVVIGMARWLGEQAG